MCQTSHKWACSHFFFCALLLDFIWNLVCKIARTEAFEACMARSLVRVVCGLTTHLFSIWIYDNDEFDEEFLDFSCLDLCTRKWLTSSTNHRRPMPSSSLALNLKRSRIPAPIRSPATSVQFKPELVSPSPARNCFCLELLSHLCKECEVNTYTTITTFVSDWSWKSLFAWLLKPEVLEVLKSMCN